MDDLEKQEGTSSILHQALCIISNPLVNLNRSYSPETLNLGKIRLFCPSDWWSWKTKVHLFYTTLSCVHLFKAIIEFKLDLHSWNTQFGSKSAIVCPMWPWSSLDDLYKQQGTFSISHQALCYISKPSVNSNLSFCPSTLNSGQNRRYFWFRMTFKFDGWPWKNGARLLCCFKLCASFHRNQWNQTVVTIRECPIWFKSHDSILVLCYSDFTDDLEKQQGVPSMLLQVHHLVAIGEFELE